MFMYCAKHFIYTTLVLSILFSCQREEVQTKEAESSFIWNDPSFPVAYPGPYEEADSVGFAKSVESMAHLANGHPERILFPLSDSIKVSLVGFPVQVLPPQEFIDFFKNRQKTFFSIQFEAFNVRSLRSVSLEGDIFVNVGRWKHILLDGSIEERYSTFLLFVNKEGQLASITEWSMCWPSNSPLTLSPNPDPSHFHYFSKSRIGSREAAVRAVSVLQALFRRDSGAFQIYLADSLNYTPSCGLNTWISKVDLASSILENNPFIGVDPISVLPFYQERQNEHIVLILNYENFIENGALHKFSYLRTFIFNEDLKIKDILVQRRPVPNAVNWNWQDARR